MASRAHAPGRRFRRLALWALALAAAWSGEAAAAEFEPDLGETLDWLYSEAAAGAGIPLQAPERARYPMGGEAIEELLDEVPGRPFHDLSDAPRSVAYWKYPVYAIFGFPRDLVDATFGLISYVPILNIPLVGVPYELFPAQAFFRDPRDWHHWPGYANSQGHGFLPGKRQVRVASELAGGKNDPEIVQEHYLLGDSWGFFPTARAMEFRYVSEARVERLRAENDRLRQELNLLNGRIDARNREIGERQSAARRAAAAALDAGDGAEAVSRMLPYHIAYPGDEQAHALLLASLALYADGGPEWVRPFLWQSMMTVNLRVARQAETLLRGPQGEFPRHRALAEALAFARIRLGDAAGALEAAESALRAEPGDARRARLVFETALSSRAEASARGALAAMQSGGLPPEEFKLLRTRLELLGEAPVEARRELAALVEDRPEDAYYRYYLGCAELALLAGTEDLNRSITSAFEQLERASLTAPIAPLQERAGRALAYVRSLAREEGRAPRERRRVLDIQLPP